jgi:hypothetical protein
MYTPDSFDSDNNFNSGTFKISSLRTPVNQSLSVTIKQKKKNSAEKNKALSL